MSKRYVAVHTALTRTGRRERDDPIDPFRPPTSPDGNNGPELEDLRRNRGFVGHEILQVIPPRPANLVPRVQAKSSIDGMSVSDMRKCFQQIKDGLTKYTDVLSNGMTVGEFAIRYICASHGRRLERDKARRNNDRGENVPSHIAVVKTEDAQVPECAMQVD